jgi:hypothetical protein
MSERSVYLRDQAAKCRWHADKLTDAETQEQLRKLAAEYIERAKRIDNTETDDKEVRPPPCHCRKLNPASKRSRIG